MDLVSFIADSAADAVAQIRARLGPDAVVVTVRPLPVQGLGRLWRRARFEVLARRPEPGSVPASIEATLNITSDSPAVPSGLESAFNTPRAGIPTQHGSPPMVDSTPGELHVPSGIEPLSGEVGAAWQVGAVLERAGLLPVTVQRVINQLDARGGSHKQRSIGEELTMTRAALAELWRKPAPFVDRARRIHVLVGAAGVGKTTSLCKWLTQVVLVEGRSASVWRLDGATANTAESLSVYCEILGLPIERAWNSLHEASTAEVQFIDLPGVEWRNPASIRQLAEQVRQYRATHVHLVVNAGYETALLLNQVRAFSEFPIDDVIVTHLDEETRWGKLWNLVVGTNCSIRFLSAGQNIPGEFFNASAETILSRQFSS
ncbi:MAG: hypothetical protein EXS31_07375 [Pedosphaera sp.]|nr:hypothetical protein [Pedosphaera sp.]